MRIYGYINASLLSGNRLQDRGLYSHRLLSEVESTEEQNTHTVASLKAEGVVNAPLPHFLSCDMLDQSREMISEGRLV